MAGESSRVGRSRRQGRQRILIALSDFFGVSVLMLRKKILEKFVGRELDDSAFRSQNHYELGMKLSGQGRHDQALAEFRQAIKLHSEFPEAHLELGSTYLSLGRLDEAIQAYSEALRIRPDYVEAYNNLGLAYDRSGNFIRALALYTKAIRYRPNDVDLRRNLGLAYFNIGSYSEAIKAYQRAIEISPTDGQAHYYLGLVHLDREDKESAMEEQKKLEELGHDDLATLLLDEVQRQTWRMAPGTDRAQEAPPARLAPHSETGAVEASAASIELTQK